MRADRDSMTWMDGDAPALGGEERSDEAPRAGTGQANRAPDPEVVAKPTRRRFTAEYRLRIVEEADRCTRPARSDGCFAARACIPRICRRGERPDAMARCRA